MKHSLVAKFDLSKVAKGYKTPEICDPEGGNLAKQNRNPGITVWQPGAAPPDGNVHY
jgi:hypothetical protein